MEEHVPITYPRVDLALARRLESAEAWSNREFIHARMELHPDHRAAFLERSGTFAMYDFPGSPLTQTFGLGMHAEVAARDMECLEAFFDQRNAPTFHEVSPLAHPSALSHLTGRGYHPVEFTNILYRPVHAIPPPGSAPALSARQIRPGEERVWNDTSARGWGEFPDLSAFMLDAGRVMSRQRNAVLFLAELGGMPVATGMMSVHDGVALLAGASTIPSHRKQGAQHALLEARLRYAHEHACTIAMMCALPGSSSQQNAERNGFRIAYTRIKWQRTQGNGRQL